MKTFDNLNKTFEDYLTLISDLVLIQNNIYDEYTTKVRNYLKNPDSQSSVPYQIYYSTTD
jgi:hypothetical protein